MIVLMNIWLAFNVVFGLWSLRNWIIWLWASFIGARVKQNTLGKMLDMAILVSIIAHVLTVNAG